MRAGRLLQQVFREEGAAFQEALQVGRELLLDERLERRAAGALGEVHAVGVVPVAAVAVLPGHRRVVLELIEPRAEQRVAALDLVVEEAERQRAVHGFDPQRQPAQLDGQRIEVDGVDAALHHVAAQHRLEARLEVVVLRPAGDQLVDQPLGGGAPLVGDAEQPHQRARAVGPDAVVVLQRGVQRVGEEAQRGQREGAGPAGRIADRQLQDLFRGLRRPARRVRGRVGSPAGAGRRLVRQRAQRALHRGHGQAGPGVEAAGTLARAAPAHQIPLAGQDHAGDQPARGPPQLPLVGEAAFRRGAPAAGAHQPGHLRRAPRPGLGSGAVAAPGVGGVVRILVRCRCRRWFGRRCRGGRVRVLIFLVPALLETLEQRLEGGVVHRFQARQRQRRLVADREEDHRVVGRRGLQFVVQQPLVEDAEVFGGEIAEVDRHHRAHAGAALANADRGAGEQPQQLPDGAVREYLLPEAGALEHGERPCRAVRRVLRAGREQGAAVRGDRQLGMMGAGAHQPEQRQYARPSGEAVPRQTAGAFELLKQPAQPVAVVIEAIVARQQRARFGEQDHHQPHRHPARGAVHLGRRDGRGACDRRAAAGVRRSPAGREAGAVARRPFDQREQRLPVLPDQNLDRFANALAEHLGQLRLPRARVAHRLQQGRRGALGRRRPQRGAEQRAQRLKLRGQLALVEPQLQVPLAPGVVVQPGEQQPPLAAVGHQRQVIAAGAQPAERLTDAAAPAADADAPFAVQEHRQRRAAAAHPQVARLDQLAGNGAPAPGRRHAAAARPGAGRGVQAADPFQHEGGEGRPVAAAAAAVRGRAALERGGALAELAGGPGVERRRDEGRQLRQPRPVEQHAAVAQPLPAGQAGRFRGRLHRRRSGRRISAATGNTRAPPAMAKRLGRRCSRTRVRSCCNCARSSS